MTSKMPSKNEWKELAESYWLTLAERLAVAILCYLAWDTYNKVGELKAASPLIEQRVISLEAGAVKYEAEKTRLEDKRDDQYSDIKEELNKLQLSVAESKGDSKATSAEIKSLTGQVDILVKQMQKQQNETQLKGKIYGRL